MGELARGYFLSSPLIFAAHLSSGFDVVHPRVMFEG